MTLKDVQKAETTITRSVVKTIDTLNRDTITRIVITSTIDSTDSTKAKFIANELSGFLEKRSEDTLFLKMWNIVESRKTWFYRLRHLDFKTGCPTCDSVLATNKHSDTTINIDDNGNDFFYVLKDSSWKNGKKFTIPFRSKILTPTNIPFRYRIGGNSDLDADFLNAGFSYFWMWGRTKFFKQEQIEPRFFAGGIGPFIAFSQLKLDSTNTNGKVSDASIASFAYGINGMLTFHNVNFIVAFGFENALGKHSEDWIYNSFQNGWHPWIGFGFGIKLIDLGFAATKEDK